MADSTKKLAPGLYTFGEVLNAAGVDFEKAAAADYNASGIDFRKVSVGGLHFDNLDNVFRVQESAEELEVRVDGKSVAKLSVSGEPRSVAELSEQANLPS
jgi:hypothetical protein